MSPLAGRSADRGAFVGRADVLGKLYTVLAEAPTSRGRVVWLTGDPRELDVGSAVSIIGTGLPTQLR